MDVNELGKQAFGAHYCFASFLKFVGIFAQRGELAFWSSERVLACAPRSGTAAWVSAVSRDGCRVIVWAKLRPLSSNVRGEA